MGYQISGGDLKAGNIAKISRLFENSPNDLERFNNPQELVHIKSFQSKDDELNWIAEQISKDINDEKLRPEDVLVIGFDHNNLFNHFNTLKSKLMTADISSIIIGKDVTKDTFHLANNVTLSTVFKAKGNEAVSVYIFNFENSERKHKIIQSRNMAFSSITRAKGWCTMTGCGGIMTVLEQEIKQTIDQYPWISFKIPDANNIKRYLDNIEYEKRRGRIKKAELSIKIALKTVKEMHGINELSDDTKSKIIEMANEIKNDGKGTQ